MNLFDLFPEESKVKEVNTLDIENELTRLFNKHQVKINTALIEELASIYKDTPPWKPWTH